MKFLQLQQCLRVHRFNAGVVLVWIFGLAAVALLPIQTVSANDLAVTDEDQISFNQQIRPIFGDICLNCHGPDEQQLQGGLRLDLRERATAEGDSGEPAIVPHDSAASELVRRILDKDDPMPPADFEKQLTPEQIATLVKWIDQGAKYEGHWAFTAPQRPDVPQSEGSNPEAHPVDAFVAKKLASAGLAFSPQADKSTLIRRLSLDLTGLPPTAIEIDEFLNDESDDAYDRVVDRLLGSPRYGERMAVAWLDYARYADSNGFQSDGSRDIWAWRDWVINAYNRNLPFDQFTIEQLAGDMLEDPSRAQVIATGFNRNHRLNGEGGRIVDEWFVETVIDRVETTGLTWLGLTFNCCRCHDHKYDPISQREFYQMFAFFNSGEESGVLAPAGKNGENTPPLLELTTPAMKAEMEELISVVDRRQSELKEAKKRLPDLVAAWEASLQADPTDADSTVWEVVKPKSVKAKGGVKFERKSDGSYLATGKNPPNATYEIKFPIESESFTGLLLEAFPDASLAKHLLGRSSNGNFVLTEIEMTIELPNSDEVIDVEFARAEALFEQPNWTAQSVLLPAVTGGGSKIHKGWATIGYEPVNGAPNQIAFVAASETKVPKNSLGTVRLFHRSPYTDHNLGRIRLRTTSSPSDQVKLESKQIPKAVMDVLAIATENRTKKQNKILADHVTHHVHNEIRSANESFAAAKKVLKDYRNVLPTTMVMKEGKRRDAYVLERGEYDQIKEQVERGLPAFLPPLPAGQPMDRLGLANWIVSPTNPLTARVWVNRAWEHFFGAGIVSTSENFGTQAAFPTHPELLDWLAVEFMQGKHLPQINGRSAREWDMKAFHKLIVTSKTYKQSSRVTPVLLERDPKNLLLARGPRFRLGGEVIRDQALAASGLLVEKIGGPSVRPYMPEGVWDETSVYGNLRNYKADIGSGRYRRTLYTIWKRTAAPPTMLLFDAPNRETCTIKRSTTNTPLQALSLLNEITFVEAAQALAKRMLEEGGDSIESKIEFGFRQVTGRLPQQREMAILKSGFLADLKKFTDDPDTARKFAFSANPNLVTDDDEKFVSSFAAYALTANVLFNLDEFVTRE